MNYLARNADELKTDKKNFLKAINKHLAFKNYLLDSNGKGEIKTVWFDKKAGSWYCQTETVGYDFGCYGIKNNPDGDVETYPVAREYLRKQYIGNIEIL